MSGFTVDIEFVNQPFGSRQPEAERLRCTETSREHAVQVCNSRSVIHKFQLHTNTAAVAQNPDSGDTSLSVNPDIAAQLGSSGRQSGDRELIEASCPRGLWATLNRTVD